jgi:hypothetical protein
VWANSIDWFGLISFALISLIFYLVRRRIEIYVVCCVIVVVLFALGTRREIVSDSRATEWWILVFGLALYAFGLLIVRIMLQRSVSLRLLARLADENRQRQESIREEIADRLRDMNKFRLIFSGKDDVYHLTPFGLFVASFVTFTYFILRIHK